MQPAEARLTGTTQLSSPLRLTDTAREQGEAGLQGKSCSHCVHNQLLCMGQRTPSLILLHFS